MSWLWYCVFLSLGDEEFNMVTSSARDVQIITVEIENEYQGSIVSRNAESNSPYQNQGKCMQEVEFINFK